MFVSYIIMHMTSKIIIYRYYTATWAYMMQLCMQREKHCNSVSSICEKHKTIIIKTINSEAIINN